MDFSHAVIIAISLSLPHLGCGGLTGSDAGSSGSAGGSDGSGNEGSAGSAGIGTSGSCSVAGDCQMSVYRSPIAAEKDCYCKHCADTAMTKTEHQKREADWTVHCTKWVAAKPCPFYKCIEPPAAECKANQCVVVKFDNQ